MQIVITEHVDDVRHDVDAAHSHVVVSLDPDDRGRSCGYAAVAVAASVARTDGVAVVSGDALDGVPDPVRICVRTESGPDPAGATLCVRRAALPVLVRVDTLTGVAVVLRRVRPEAQVAAVPTDPDPEPAEVAARERAPRRRTREA